MSTWNCRVVQSANGTGYFVAEVHYDAGERLSRVDDSRDCLRWDEYDDLKSAVDPIRQAFDKPVLRVTDDERLVEGRPT